MTYNYEPGTDTAQLDAAEQKVTVLTAGEQGEPVERPFDGEE